MANNCLWLMTDLGFEAFLQLEEWFEVVDQSKDGPILFQDPADFVHRLKRNMVTALVLPTFLPLSPPLFEELRRQSHPLGCVGYLGLTDDRWDWEVVASSPMPIFYPAETYASTQAEYALGALITVLRNIHLADLELRTTPPDQTQDFQLWRERFVGTELRGKTVGFLGWDALAAALVPVLTQFFGCKVKVWLTDCHSPTPAPQVPSDLPLVVVRERMDLFRDVDILSLHLTPLSSPVLTEELLGTNPGVVVVNLTSALVLPEETLLTTYEQDHLAGAVIDTFDFGPTSYSPELLAIPRVLATPRLAAVTAEVEERASDQLAKDLVTWARTHT